MGEESVSCLSLLRADCVLKSPIESGWRGNLCLERLEKVADGGDPLFPSNLAQAEKNVSR